MAMRPNEGAHIHRREESSLNPPSPRNTAHHRRQSSTTTTDSSPSARNFKAAIHGSKHPILTESESTERESPPSIARKRTPHYLTPTISSGKQVCLYANKQQTAEAPKLITEKCPLRRPAEKIVSTAPTPQSFSSSTHQQDHKPLKAASLTLPKLVNSPRLHLDKHPPKSTTKSSKPPESSKPVT